jgi:hypothetical protein
VLAANRHAHRNAGHAIMLADWLNCFVDGASQVWLVYYAGGVTVVNDQE